MERWAANTLRILGIIVTSIVVVCGGLVLILFGQCAAQGGLSGGVHNPTLATSYFFGAVLLGLAGIALIAVLARGVFRSSRMSAPAPANEPSASESPASTLSLAHLSPASRQAINLLSGALVTQLVVSALELARTVVWYRLTARDRHSIVPIIAVSSTLFVVPFALILYFVRRRPSRSVMAFALGIPAAAILVTLIATVPLLHFYVQNTANLTTVIIPFLLDLVILVFAYQAQQRIGLKLPASSLLTALIVSFVYFYSIHLVMRFAYRVFPR